MSQQNLDFYTQYLIDQFVPVTIFMTKDLDVLYTHGNIEDYLRFPRALVAFNLRRMLDREVLILFENGIDQCLNSGRPLIYHKVPFRKDREDMLVDLRFQLIKLDEADEQTLLVEIRPSPLAPDTDELTEEMVRSNVWEEQVRNLERQLKGARQQTQNLVNEQEATNEELQASNRELMASNEELQSTNEELQSVNEELYTVNSELQLKNQALTTANDDIVNLLKSTEIGTIFLDKDLKVRRFTPAIRKHLNLLDIDIGRPISDFSSNLLDIDISKVSREVFLTLDKFEREVEDTQGNHYLIRILPYRTSDDLIQGLVITFVDVNELIKIREKMITFAERFEAIFQNSEDTILELNNAGKIEEVSKAIASYSREALVGSMIYDLLSEKAAEEFRLKLAQMFKSFVAVSHKLEIYVPDRGLLHFQARLIPLRHQQDGATFEDNPHAVLVVMHDITLGTRQRNELSENLEEYEAFMDNARHQIALVDRQGKIKYVNYTQHTGLSKAAMIGSSMYEYIPVPHRNKVKQSIEQIFAGEVFDTVRFSLTNVEGKALEVELVATPVIIGEQIKYIALIGYQDRSL